MINKPGLNRKTASRDITEDPLYDLWVLLARTYFIINRTREQEVSTLGVSRPMAFLLFVINARTDTFYPLSFRTLTANI